MKRETSSFTSFFHPRCFWFPLSPIVIIIGSNPKKKTQTDSQFRSLFGLRLWRMWKSEQKINKIKDPFLLDFLCKRKARDSPPREIRDREKMRQCPEPDLNPIHRLPWLVLACRGFLGVRFKRACRRPSWFKEWNPYGQSWKGPSGFRMDKCRKSPTEEIVWALFQSISISSLIVHSSDTDRTGDRWRPTKRPPFHQQQNSNGEHGWNAQGILSCCQSVIPFIPSSSLLHFMETVDGFLLPFHFMQERRTQEDETSDTLRNWNWPITVTSVSLAKKWEKKQWPTLN